jgi:hypothetical protein
MLYHDVRRGRNGNDHPAKAKEWVHGMTRAIPYQAQGRDRPSRVTNVDRKRAAAASLEKRETELAKPGA